MKDIWNSMAIAKRKALLIEAGYTPNLYAFRCFDYIPSWVRDDVEYTFKRSRNKQTYAEATA